MATGTANITIQQKMYKAQIRNAGKFEEATLLEFIAINREVRAIVMLKSGDLVTMPLSRVRLI